MAEALQNQASPGSEMMQASMSTFAPWATPPRLQLTTGADRTKSFYSSMHSKLQQANPGDFLRYYRPAPTARASRLQPRDAASTK